MCAQVNDDGISIAVNNLGQLNHSRSGLPVAMVIRLLLRQRHHAEAVELALSLPHASGQNYTIGGPEGDVTMIEGSANGAVVASRATAAQPILYHTNHPVCSVDYTPSFEGENRFHQFAVAAAFR